MMTYWWSSSSSEEKVWKLWMLATDSHQALAARVEKCHAMHTKKRAKRWPKAGYLVILSWGENWFQYLLCVKYLASYNSALGCRPTGAKFITVLLGMATAA